MTYIMLGTSPGILKHPFSSYYPRKIKAFGFEDYKTINFMNHITKTLLRPYKKEFRIK